MARALLFVFALVVMVGYCSAQTCRSLIGSSCTGDQYTGTCMGQEVNCTVTWNNTCYSRSDLASVLGKSFQYHVVVRSTSFQEELHVDRCLLQNAQTKLKGV